MNPSNRTLVAACVAVAALAQASAFADQLSDIKARGTLICGVLPAVQPFGFQDPQTREIVGYDVDFCRAVAKNLGVKPELKITSSESRMPELMQGRVDLLVAALSYSQPRAEQIDFSDSYYVGQVKLFVRQDRGYKTRDDLVGKRIAMTKGSSFAPVLTTLMPTSPQLAFEAVPIAVLAVVQGKADAYVGGESTLMGFKAKMEAETPMMVLSPAVMLDAWGMGVHKGEPALLKAVNDALATIEKSGEAQQIFDHWLGSKSSYKMAREFKIEPIKR
jgi:polar amino acid transport system substrate-binding protein